MYMYVNPDYVLVSGSCCGGCVPCGGCGPCGPCCGPCGPCCGPASSCGPSC